MNFKEKLSPSAQKKLSDLLFIFYAGGAALLSYSLVYALRKPFTAATFDGMELFGMDDTSRFGGAVACIVRHGL